MSDANYKNRLRKRLDNHSTPMNLESEWAALEARRPAKKKRPFIWFWFGSVAVMIVILVWYSSDQVSSASTLPSKSNSENKEQQPTVSVSSTKEFITNIESQTVNEQQSVGDSNTFSNKTKVAKTDNQNIQTDLVNNKIETILAIKKEAIFDPPKMISNSITPNKNQTNSNKSKINFTQTIKLPNKEISLLSYSSPIPIISFIKTEREGFTESKNPVWAVGFNAAYGKSFRQLEAINPTKKLLIDQRNKSETALDSWKIALNLTRMINQNWFGEIGIGYSQTTDRFQDNYIINNSLTLSDQVISIIYKKDGTTDIISGEVIGEETITTKATFYHYSKNAFAQIIVGRKISFNNRFGSSFSTGLNYSLLTHKSGTIFSDDSAATYDNLSESNYRKTGLTNLIIQAEVYYQINKNWEASLGLQASGTLNNSFQNNSDFSEKRKAGNLQVGLKKWF